MRRFGLIGKRLSHSFSARFFGDKFNRENLSDHTYALFELPSIDGIKDLFDQDLAGLNVTLPYKQAIIPYLDALDPSAQKVGAVNVVKFENNRKVGYNSDYTGFRKSLESWLPGKYPEGALVLGTGGASRAVIAVLNDLGIRTTLVSRTKGKGLITYDEIDPELIGATRLIVNTTPLGMYPNVDMAPEIPYGNLSDDHFLYDLVYNPEVTLFMKKGRKQGAHTKNGLEMLYIQAERSWEIWNEK